MDQYPINHLNNLIKKTLDLPRPVKRAVALGSDVCLCVLSVWLAFYLRLGEFVSLSGPTLWPVFAAVGLGIPIFIFSGLYRAIFRYSGLPAMLTMARAMLLYGVIFSAIFTFYGVEGVPRTVGLIQPLMLGLLVGTSRTIVRLWLGGAYQFQLRRRSLSQVLIYGAGSAGQIGRSHV